MNVGLIIAGGSGDRMYQDIPKQFLTVNERPVIIYTLEAFEKHPEIEAIAVVLKVGSRYFGPMQNSLISQSSNTSDLAENGRSAERMIATMVKRSNLHMRSTASDGRFGLRLPEESIRVHITL